MKKSIIRIILSAAVLVALSAPSYSKGVYVLCYHAFVDRKDPYSVRMETFKEQLRELKKNGFTFVTFEDVTNNRVNGNKNILVTIDDGNKSVYEAYFSVMKPLGIKPVLGIYPAIISNRKYAMNWDEVKKLYNEGCYIASHGYHHMYLSEKYFKQDRAGFMKEIYQSKKVLEAKLGCKIDTMLYPFGVYSEIAISELKNAGYRYGFSIEPKMASVPFADNFHINRYMITKPAGKGIIARITKNASNDQAGSGQGSVNSATVSDTGTGSKTGISLINYPETIKKITDTKIIIPESTETDKKKQAKFKPFVHDSGSRKLAGKHEKKNHRKKRPA